MPGCAADGRRVRGRPERDGARRELTQCSEIYESSI
jgi:hypothetical protein